MKGIAITERARLVASEWKALTADERKVCLLHTFKDMKDVC
jgi:hypothetical protein